MVTVVLASARLVVTIDVIEAVMVTVGVGPVMVVVVVAVLFTVLKMKVSTRSWHSTK